MSDSFARPDASAALSPVANALYGVGLLASRMVQVTRTLCDHPDGRPENDAEHSYMLGLTAMALASDYYPALNSGLVAQYALVHDLVEAYVGDTATHDISVSDLQSKANREAAGLVQLVDEYGTDMPNFTAVIEAYERQVDPESRFVRMLDKIMTISVQFPNHGVTMRAYFESASSHKAMVDTRIERFLADYPDQREILDLYEELAVYMRSLVWPGESA